MKIVLLGSGNVASALGGALQLAQHDVVAVWSRTIAHAKELADKLHTAFTDELSDLPEDADLYILSVSDDAIKTVAADVFFDGKALVHTSGTSSIHIQKISGVFYPLQTFSKKRAVDFTKVPVIVEGLTAELTNMLLELGRSISKTVQVGNSAQRKALHVAAVFANNFSNHLFSIAEDILNANGMDFDLIKPLIAETAAKVQVLSPKLAQTGPAVRNDQLTINTHLAFLTEHPALELYALLSKIIAHLSQDNPGH